MVYLVGDAPNGWDIGNATPMESTDNPNIFTWSGNLKGGELKFTLDKQNDWNVPGSLPVSQASILPVNPNP